jgi:hypothetical protein
MWQIQVKEIFLPSDDTIFNFIKLNNSVHFHKIWALEMKWGNDLMIFMTIWFYTQQWKNAYIKFFKDGIM